MNGGAKINRKQANAENECTPILCVGTTIGTLFSLNFDGNANVLREQTLNLGRTNICPLHGDDPCINRHLVAQMEPYYTKLVLLTYKAYIKESKKNQKKT